MRPLFPAPSAAPLLRRSEAGGGGGLVFLLLAERAPSEGFRSTRAIEDQPGHLLEKQTSKQAWGDHYPLDVRTYEISLAIPGVSRSLPHASL